MRDSGYDYRNLGLHITSLPTQPITIFVIGYTFGDTPRLTHVAHPYLEHQLCYIHIMVFLLTISKFSQVLVGCQDNTTVTVTPTQDISLPENPQSHIYTS